MKEFEVVDTNPDNIGACGFCGYKGGRSVGHRRKSEWLEKPNLVEIKKQRQGPGEDVRLSDFTLRFQQIDPKKGSEEEDKSS